MVARHLELGKQGEKLAEKYLKSQGYKILEKNFSFAYGEIDLICEYKDILVFVEVRVRQNKQVSPQETLTKKKLAALYKTAEKYLTLHNLWHRECRFDFVGIIYENKQWKLEHTKDFISWTPVCNSHSSWQPW